MNARPFGRGGLCLVAILVLTACGGDDMAGVDDIPEPGEVAMVLAAPREEAGAILMRLSGPALPTSFTAVMSGSLLEFRPDQTELHIAVFGVLDSGDIARFPLPDLRRIGEYRVIVSQIADRSNALGTASEYTVRLERR